MIAEGLSCFSVINTSLKMCLRKGEPWVSKTIRPNISLPLSTVELAELFRHYLHTLKENGITLPEIIEDGIDGNGLKYLCRYEGSNIVQFFEPMLLVSIDNKTVLDKIFEIIAIAVRNNVYLDPHPKNFVWNGETVTFVDFSPPLIDSYFKARLDCAGTEEKEIISANFQYFSPEWLPYHFAGDFRNIDSALGDVFYLKLHKLLCNSGLLNCTYDYFLTRSMQIRDLEDCRIEREIKLF